MTEKKIIIAIDGHASCGKSTIAKALAQKLQYTYIDTGAMYRCVTLFSLRNGIITNAEIDQEKLKKNIDKVQIDFRYNTETDKAETWLNGENVEEEIRTLRVSDFVSPISQIKFVREKLVAMQQKLGEKKGVIMDGRDIGTVVFPNAELKLFVTASARARAKRRYKELTEKGQEVDLQEIERNITKRDHIDSTRKESPLKQANDAILLDNSNMDRQQQMEWVLNVINDRIGK